MFRKANSDFLFALPSSLSGSARALDLGGLFDQYNTSDDPDGQALAADWLVIGDDMCSTFIEQRVLESIAETR